MPEAEAVRLFGCTVYQCPCHDKLASEREQFIRADTVIQQAFIKVSGRWHIRTSSGSLPVADDIAYLVARAREHPEWPENPS